MPQLTPCQEKALKKLDSRDNIFLTGFAGTGKSFLIRHFIKGLDRKAFPVLASTGVAAVLIGGRTFHSFFGLGIMEGGLEATIDRACGERSVKSRVKKIKGFVLDEVSMISGEALTAAEAICRYIRKIKYPWGGLQVITVGDFAQLPPVGRYGSDRDWAFLSPTWQDTEFKPALLETVVRTNDQEYIEVLNDIRQGTLSETTASFLDQRIEPCPEDYSNTCLFPHRKTTDSYNLKRLNEIDAELVIFPTRYTGKKQFIEILKKSASIPEELFLKEGAHIMTRINDPQYRYINGSTGQIEEINENTILVRLKSGRLIEIAPASFSLLNAEGNEVASATNFPVNLAYATTIHKSQGSTMSDLMIDLKRLWEPGQAYVALSRLEKGSGLKLSGWSKSSIKADPQVTAFHEGLIEKR